MEKRFQYLAKISEKDYDQWRKKFGINTGNWDDPENVGEITIAALNNGFRRGLVPYYGPDPTVTAAQKVNIEAWMTEFEESFSRDYRTLTESEREREEWLLGESGVLLARSGKVYGSEGSFQRWLALADAFKERERGSGGRPKVPFTAGFREDEFYGHYLKIWDLRLEELAQSEEQ